MRGDPSYISVCRARALSGTGGVRCVLWLSRGARYCAGETERMRKEEEGGSEERGGGLLFWGFEKRWFLKF